MENKFKAYGKLCSIFYDATKKYPPQAEVDFYTSFMNKDSRVLEAMCGSGRLLVPFIQLGFTVDGVDNSKIMLDRTKKRCEDLNLKSKLYEQSLDNLNLEDKYDVVTIAVGSFQLIVDHEIALRSLKKLHDNMNSGASLLIDFFVPDFSAEEQSVRIVRLDNNSVIKLTTRYVFDKEKKIADAFCFYELIVDGVIEEKEDELIELTWYTDQELIKLLDQAGFDVVKIYDKTFRLTGPSRIIHACARF